MEKILAVLTAESRYAERLCSYCNRGGRFVLTAVPFSGIAECADFSRRHNIEVLLVDSDMLSSAYGSSQVRDIRASRVIRLTEGISFGRAFAESPDIGTETGFINKYQPAESLIRDIMQQCEGMDIVNTMENAGRPVRIIGVYSPVGRCGKTSFALTLSSLSGKKRKTLYLNLEEFSGLASLTGESYDTGLSDALYHMKQGTLSSQKLYAMIRSYKGIDYIPPMKYADDRNAVDGSDYVRLIGSIVNNSRYEVIVADMDRFSDGASDIMEICNVIYMPVLDNYTDRMKTESFLEYLRNAGRNRILDKIVRISTPRPEPGMAGGTSYMDALLYGRMGDLVRELKEA